MDLSWRNADSSSARSFLRSRYVAEDAAVNPIPFDVITQPFEYWQDFTGVLLHMGQTLSANDVDLDTFKVHAKNTSRNNNAVLWNDYRTITDVYVADAEGNRAASGQYVMICLRHGVTQYNTGSGSSISYWRRAIEESRTGQFAGDANRSIFVTIEYTITQQKEIPGMGYMDYVQNPKWVDKVVDKFKMDTFPGTLGNMHYAFYKPFSRGKKQEPFAAQGVLVLFDFTCMAKS